MGAVGSKEKGMCKWQSISGPWKSSLKVRRDESMGTWVNNTNMVDRAEDRGIRADLNVIVVDFLPIFFQHYTFSHDFHR